MIAVRIGSSLPLLPTTVADRGARARSDFQPAPATRDTDERIPQREATRIRSRVATASTVQDFSQSNLSQRSRSALQSYQMNGPSLSERLGVELAGIDVLV